MTRAHAFVVVRVPAKVITGDLDRSFGDGSQNSVKMTDDLAVVAGEQWNFGDDKIKRKNRKILILDFVIGLLGNPVS